MNYIIIWSEGPSLFSQIRILVLKQMLPERVWRWFVLNLKQIICIWMNALNRKFTQFRLMPHKLLSWYSGHELFIESLKKKCDGSLARQELFLLQIYENKHLSITTQNCLYSCRPVLTGKSCWVGSLTCWEKGLSKKWNYYRVFLNFFLKRKNARFDEFRVATDLWNPQ